MKILSKLISNESEKKEAKDIFDKLFIELDNEKVPFDAFFNDFGFVFMVIAESNELFSTLENVYWNGKNEYYYIQKVVNDLRLNKDQIYKNADATIPKHGNNLMMLFYLKTYNK